MAAAMHVSGNRTIGNWDGSTLVIKINEDGRVFLISGECDMGQGASTMLSQIVAHEPGPASGRYSCLRPIPMSPVAVGTLASRVTMSGGNAAIIAARKARQELLSLAAERLDAPPDALTLEGGAVYVSAEPERRSTVAEPGTPAYLAPWWRWHPGHRDLGPEDRHA